MEFTTIIDLRVQRNVTAYDPIDPHAFVEGRVYRLIRNMDLTDLIGSATVVSIDDQVTIHGFMHIEGTVATVAPCGTVTQYRDKMILRMAIAALNVVFSE